MSQKGLPSVIVAAVGAVILITAITFFIFEITDHFHSKPEDENHGYNTDVTKTAAVSPTTAPTPAAQPAGVDITPYLAKADLTLGAKLIKRCQICHNFEAGKPTIVGPNQHNLINRKVASVEGFDYSDAMKAKGGSWTFQALSDYLTNPREALPGNKMGYPGLSKPEDRAALIMYINQTYNDKPAEIK